MHRAAYGADQRAQHPLRIANDAPVVLYVVNQYPAVTHTFIKREVQALERLGVEVIRVAARAGKALVDPGDIEEERQTTYLLRQPFGLLRAVAQFLLLHPHRFARALVTTLCLMRRSDRGPLLHALYLVEACGVASLVRRTGAAHIHAHFGTNPAELALLAAQLTGVTFSFTVHGYDEYDKPEFIGLRTKIHEAAFVVAVSHYGRSQLYRWSDAVDQSKIKLIRCGLDQGFHEAAEDRPDDAARLVCVGRLCKEKGQSILIKAAAAVAAAGHRFELAMIGDGEARPELESLIEELGLSGSVRLLGWRSSADVRREILGARALVVASLAENLPVVIMEAMALRRPVVATQIAGIPELVRSRETGWLVPAGCVEDLAAAMTECLLTPREELRAMGCKSRERVVALHDVDREAAALARLFAEQASCRRDALNAAERPLTTAAQ
ncbi:glycosyltransferase family 4 protein [Bradyrhizobium sp. ORS 111]|uniref:glycosyltransferase family 4 protein n=1 Tax=Bradyrhizobium sp. ORS 111 TaxID=1685958 RepID=UPI00388DBF1F